MDTIPTRAAVVTVTNTADAVVSGRIFFIATDRMIDVTAT